MVKYRFAVSYSTHDDTGRLRSFFILRHYQHFYSQEMQLVLYKNKNGSKCETCIDPKFTGYNVSTTVEVICGWMHHGICP